jgi:cytochrome c-type biogenesis protein CcmH/NrfF
MSLASAGFHLSRSSALRWAILAAATVIAILLASMSLSWAARPSVNPVSPEETEILEEVRAIASMLRAPCCPNLTVSQHNSPTTIKMKGEIEAMVRAGKGRSAIIAELKAEYGEVIAPSMLPALYKPYLYVGGPILGLLILALMGRWLFRHERTPTVLHMVQEPDEDKSSKHRAA